VEPIQAGAGGLVPVPKAVKIPTRRSGNEVARDAKYCDAGQDQKRYCAGYAAP